MKRLFPPIFLFPFALFSQTPFPTLPPVFRDDVVPRVDITLPPDSLDLMLVPGSEYHWHASFVFDNGQIKDTVENIGVKIKGNTSAGAAKKSFRVSFNTYQPGRKWNDLEKLNLNGSHNDPVSSRSKISWDLLRWMGVPGARANHISLYMNGQYFGVYNNVEHIDEQFVKLRFGNDEGNLYKCLWPADLAYKGANPDLYKEEYGGRRAYELVTNAIADDYSDLAHFIDVLNNASNTDLPCELEEIFNVDSYLKAAAFDVLSGNWDGMAYNKNNFYLYHNVATDQFEYIPYDLDNSMGIDWLNVNWLNRNIYFWAHPSEPRPLFKRLLAVPEYKDRFSFYIEEYLQSAFHPDTIFPYLDNMKALISEAIQTDPYYPLDYGFDFDDFEEGWENELPYFQTPFGIKSYINGRWDFANQQLVTGDISPIIQQASHIYLPSANNIAFHATALDDSQTSGVKACFHWDGQAQNCLDLFDDGQHDDGVSGDGNFGNNLDITGQTGLFEYFIQATDDTGQQSSQPLCDWRVIYVGENLAPLVLNEFMASNTNTYPDEAGEFEDWIEIFNPGNTALSLQHFYLTDDESLPAKWRLPNTNIPAQGYQVFWADSDEAAGSLHANFKLDIAGEFLAIYEKNADGFSLVDRYIFGEQAPGETTGRLPNGTGGFQQVNPTPGATNQAYTAVNEIAGDNVDIQLSPNPATDWLKISLARGQGNLSDLALVNTLGKVILQASGLDTPFYEMNTHATLPGTYLLKVKTTAGRIGWRRVIILRN